MLCYTGTHFLPRIVVAYTHFSAKYVHSQGTILEPLLYLKYNDGIGSKNTHGKGG